jgi:hypothetical protein
VPRPHLRDPKLEQFWRKTLAAWAASGLNVRDFCREHRLAEPSFYAWRREIAARDGNPVPEPAAPPEPVPPRRRSKPAPRPVAPAVRRPPVLAPKPGFVAQRVVPDAPLEVVLRSGHVLRIPPGYDGTHLRAVVAALEAAPC